MQTALLHFGRGVLTDFAVVGEAGGAKWLQSNMVRHGPFGSLQPEALCKPYLRFFVNVSGLVLSAATSRTMGHVPQLSTVDGHSLGTRAAAFSGGEPHIFSRCADEAGGAK